MDWLIKNYTNMPYWWVIWVATSLAVVAVGLISLVIALSIPWVK